MNTNGHELSLKEEVERVIAESVKKHAVLRSKIDGIVGKIENR